LHAKIPSSAAAAAAAKTAAVTFLYMCCWLFRGQGTYTYTICYTHMAVRAEGGSQGVLLGGIGE